MSFFATVSFSIHTVARWPLCGKHIRKVVIKLMEKLIEDLNLKRLFDENDDLVKISLSPLHSRTQLMQAIDDYSSEHLNYHIALGMSVSILQSIRHAGKVFNLYANFVAIEHFHKKGIISRRMIHQLCQQY